MAVGMKWCTMFISCIGCGLAKRLLHVHCDDHVKAMEQHNLDTMKAGNLFCGKISCLFFEILGNADAKILARNYPVLPWGISRNAAHGYGL